MNLYDDDDEPAIKPATVAAGWAQGVKSWSKVLSLASIPLNAMFLFPLYVFLLFIGPESDHWQCLSLTDWLTDSCLVNLLCLWQRFVYLDFSLLRLSRLMKLNFCSVFEHKVWWRFWSWSSGKISNLEFGQYFAADVLQRLWRWILGETLKLGSVNILNFKFSQDAGRDWEVNGLSIIFWRWNLIKICVLT